MKSKSQSQFAFLLLTVFVSGMSVMGIEMSAARLLAPYFGNSLLIWTVLIGLVLIYLTVGYYLGGRLADRSPRASLMFQLIAWAGFAIGLIPFISKPVLRYSVIGFAEYSVGLLAGSLLAVILLFAVPVTLLGCVSPFAIRLSMRDVDSAGNTAGSIYALSTLGSIVGTFAPVLLLIPNIGTRRTILLFSIVLIVLSLIGLVRVASRRVVLYAVLLLIIILLIVLIPAGVIKASEGMLYETESAHNYIQVIQEEGTTYLHLNEGEGIHSIYTPGQVLTYGIWDLFLIAPFLNNPPFASNQVKSLLMIGLAGGTIPKQYTDVYGPIPIDGVELDSEIIEVGRQYFDMTEPNLNAIPQDGRYFLTHSSRRYDVIAVDAYRPPYIPFHLTTQEFFREVYDHLTDTGVLAINVGRAGTDYDLVNVLASTAKSVFPNVYIIDALDYGSDLGNSLVAATKQPTTPENFAANMALIDNPYLIDVAELALPTLRPFSGSNVVFTDDKAPVEQVIHGLIVRFVLGLP
jgi:predicted membrane-bound spermidine synthase